MSGKTYLTNQKYFKPNYFEAVKYIVPQYLTEDDISTFGQEVDIKDQVINSHLDIANSLSDVIVVSGVEDTIYSNVSSLSGIAPYFVKQNGLTNITTERFETKILSPLKKSILDYKTSASFSSYVSNTLLPSIALNNPTAVFTAGHSPSDTHNYLIENLSWMYFLNTTGTYFDPSSYVSDLIVNNIYFGKPIATSDGIKGLMEHVWKNKKTAFYPATTFASGAGTYVSGTQQLDNLKTWVDVVYSPLHSDKSDFTVRDRFETFIDSSLKISNEIPNGPFTKFLRALSFIAFDIDNQSELLSTLYDIDECPDEFLPLLAELIGWDLFGSDPSRWRLQLRNAVSIYKAVGTKKSLKFAMNSVFPKDAFDLESKVVELYESYVPFLIYYALATESSVFKSLATWTPEVADSLDVVGYSTSSLDENLKLATDRILYEIYLKFKGTNGFQPFPGEELGYNYRGRTYPIPPFEEYPYYANFEVRREVIDFLADRLACFGVRDQFALDVSGYLHDNVINVDDEPRAASFLFFTSAYNEPPNTARLLQDLNNEKFEYVSLWSGKSSHFKVFFNANSFDFDTKGIALGQETTGDAFVLASQITRRMAPAHSIPLVSLELSSVDTLPINVSSLPLIFPDKVEIESGASRNYFLSGLNLNSYKRGYNTGGKDIGRSATQTLASPEILTATNAINIPRKSLRRRSYDNLMSFNGYYDRTGFNMPSTFAMASGLTLSGIPLGLIPSSYEYTPVSDHVNLPSIWSRCETLDSDSSYYEYDVSNTIPFRGQASGAPRNDRGQLPDVYAAMHDIREHTKVMDASAAYGPVSLYVDSVSNVYQSYANSATQASGWFPNSAEDFYNFSFGKDLHTLYTIYTSTFERHQMNERLQYVDGANLFSHTFGPILYNHNLEDVARDSSFLASSIDAITYFSPVDSLFTGPLSYAASDPTDMYLDTSERVVSGAIPAVELIQTSGSGKNNLFSIFKIDSKFKKATDDPYMFDNTFIISRATERGLPRVRFDMSKYTAPSDRPIATNFLVPDHEQELKVKTLVTIGGNNFGGRAIGMWIHTKPEGGKMWSYTSKGQWEQHDQLIGRQDVVSTYSHVVSLPRRTKEVDPFSPESYECLDVVPYANSYNPAVTPVSRLRETDFEELIVKFNTTNRNILLPSDYQKAYKQLHRKDQQYVVEVFMVPNGDVATFMLLDTVELQDLTLKKLSEIFVNGKYQDPQCIMPQVVGNCPEYRHPLSKDRLRQIFKFFNDIAGKNSAQGIASRDAFESSAIMDVSGGSRLDYRNKTSWNYVIKNAAQVIEGIILDA